MRKNRRLQDEYQFPGFHPQATTQGIFGDSHAKVVVLRRRQKKQRADVVGLVTGVFTIGGCAGFGICLAARNGFTWRWKSGGYSARGAAW
jgi:hypothetical protein